MSEAENTAIGAKREYRYFAFISYSRKDSKAAAWLQRRLEWFRFPVKLVPEDRRPPHPKYIQPIYRDKTNLEVTDEHYWTNIRRALKESHYLIVLCSPNSAVSEPVNLEVAHFLETHGSDTSLIAPVIVSGNVTSIGADAALCPALFALGGAIIDRNLPTMVPDAVTAEQDAWEQGFVSLVSYLLRLERSALGDHIQRETRRQKRVLQRWLAAVGILTVIAMAAGAVALWQRAEANQQRGIAESNAKIAQDNAIESQSNAAQAQANARRALENLAQADLHEGTQRLTVPETSGEGIALLARASRLVNLPAAQTRLWALLQQRQFWAEVSSVPAQLKAMQCDESDPPPAQFATVTFENEGRKPDWFSLSADGKTCVTIINGNIVDGTTDKHRFRVWRIDGTPITPWLEVGYKGLNYVSKLHSAHLSADGRVVAVVANPWREPQFIEVWDVAKMKPIGNPIHATGSVPVYQGSKFYQVRFLPQKISKRTDHVLLLTTSSRGDASLIAAYFDFQGLQLCARARHATAVVSADVDDKALWLMSASEDGHVIVTDTDKGELVGHPFDVEPSVQTIGYLAPDRLRVVTKNDATHDYRLTSLVAIPPPPGLQFSEMEAGDPWKLDKPRDGSELNAVLLPTPGTIMLRSADNLRFIQLTKSDSLSLLSKTKDGETKQHWAHTFPSAIYRVRFSAAEQLLIVQTGSFVTEVWNPETNKRLGYPVNELKLFQGSLRPAKSLLASVDALDRRLLTRSFFMDFPDSPFYWFTVWDLQSGLPAIDQIEQEGNHAEFSQDGKFLLIGKGEEKNPIPTKAIQLEPPSTVLQGLPEAAEALGGFTARDDGTFAPVADRMQKIEMFLSKLQK